MQIRTIYTLTGAIKGAVLGFILGVALLIIGVLTILDRTPNPSTTASVIMLFAAASWILVIGLSTYRSRMLGIATEKKRTGEVLEISIKAYRKFFLWSIMLLLVSYAMGAYVFQYNFLTTAARNNALSQVSNMPTYSEFHQIRSLRPIVTQDGKNLNIALETSGGAAGNYNLILVLNDQFDMRKTELFPLPEQPKNKLITYSAEDLIITLFSLDDPEDGPPSTTFSFDLNAELLPMNSDQQEHMSRGHIALITTIAKNENNEYRIIDSNIASP